LGQFANLSGWIGEKNTCRYDSRNKINLDLRFLLCTYENLHESSFFLDDII